MKKLVIGILAHVDAGKTTLSEALLYKSGVIRKLGRVDHRDAFLDTNAMERDRGITIFSKQAVLTFADTEITLLDTPGHVDFSSETERTLQVLDYAVLIISATDGIQAHTRTLWRLLARYRVPTFIFVNKIDLPGKSREEITSELKKSFGDGCIDFGGAHGTFFAEQLAMCDEDILEIVMSEGRETAELKNEIVRAVAERKVFPCFFGSALKLDGIDTFLQGFSEYTRVKKYPETFGAKVYKISRDASGTRLTHIKITGGVLKTKAILSQSGNSSETSDEKVDQIRLYNGTNYKTVEIADAGTVCTVTGLKKTYPGEGLGIEFETDAPVLEPVLSYRVCVPQDCNNNDVYIKMKQLEEEDPQLHVVWNDRLRDIHVRLMGEVQLEILHRLFFERYGTDISFDEGNILYKETIMAPVEGVGHFEPLRHYAEVHLLLEPGEEGSGLYFDTVCSESVLERNWQRLVLTHLAEKCHIGVLTGSPITDMKITLLTGRASNKHTVGGDFRQATYRAVREGLMEAEPVLLEPYYTYRLEVPNENIGRAMNDITRMSGTFGETESGGEMAVLTGRVPVSLSRGYAAEVTAYTKGLGHFTSVYSGYGKCHNQDEVVAAMGYDYESDTENTPDSVFCVHGAGYVVKWNEVKNNMHVESPLTSGGVVGDGSQTTEKSVQRPLRISYEEANILDKELLDIFERTYGAIKPRKAPPEPKRREFGDPPKQKTLRNPVVLPEYVLVDGYNIIFAWDDLKKVAKDNLNLARQLLINILCNYQGYCRCGLILVFDAYKVTGGKGSVERHGGINVVYTKEAETADTYIERVTYEIGRKYRVRVATSDNLEQIIVLGHGATRVSARAFYDEVSEVRKLIDKDIDKINNG